MSNNPHHSRFFWRSAAMFCILDFEMRFKEVNAAWEKTLGLSTGQLLSKSLLDFIHHEDEPATRYYIEQLRDGSISTSFTGRFRHQNGSYRHLLWEITSAASQEDAYYVVAMDISGRERASVADDMISVLEEGVVLQYANGTIGACNPSAERILGLPADQMIGWTLIDPDWNAIREDGSPFPTETHPAICSLRTGKPYIDTIMGVEKPDGTVIWLHIDAHPLWRDEITPYAVVISFSDVSHYKQKEQALREQGEIPAFPSQPVGSVDYDFWHWNLETNEIIFPPHWKAMLGYQPNELVNHIDTWYRRIHPLDYKKVLADIQNHLEGVTAQFENLHRLQHRDGSYRWVRAKGVAVRDAAGTSVSLIGMHADITNQQQSEDKRQISETKYQHLLDTESDAVFLVEADSDRILEVNRIASQVYGYNRTEFLGMRRADLSAQTEKAGAAAKRSVRQVRRRHHKRKDDSVFPVEITTSPFVLQGREVLMITVRDISERQQIETALWESQSKYRQLFEASSSAIVVFDANTQQVFDVNNVAVDMYGYTKEEWLRLTTHDLSAEPVKSRATLYSGKRHQIIPLRWHKKRDGVVFPVEISTGSSYLFQGRSLVCATLRDITERRAAEEALRTERDFVNTLVQASPTFFVAINPDGSIRMANKAMLDGLGYTLEELTGQPYLETLIAAEDRIRVATEMELLTRAMRPSLMEAQLRGKQGQLLRVEWHSRAIVQADGGLDYLFGVGIDVTDREKVRSDLLLFKSIVEASDEGLAICDPQGQVVYVNPAYQRLLGRDLATVQQHPRAHYPPESLEILEREVQPALTQGRSWSGELDLLGSDDQHLLPVWQRFDAVRDTQGQILFRFELMHDISERKRMWETLRTQWEEYELIFNNVPVMIWYWSSDEQLLRANQLAQEAFRDVDMQTLVYPTNRAVMTAGEPLYREETLLLHSLGGERRLHTGRIPYRNGSGALCGLIMFAVDMTDCKPLAVSGNADSVAEHKLRRILEQLPLLVNAVDERGHVLTWNRSYEQVSGYTAREVLSNPGLIRKIYPDLAQWGRLCSREGGERSWEGQILCKDGNTRTVRWYNLGAQHPVAGWHSWQVGQLTDFMVRGHEKTAIDKTERDNLLNYVFDTTQIGVCLTDDRGRFLKVNRAYSDLYGYPIEELLDKPFTLILPSKRQDEAIRDYFSMLISNEGPKLLEYKTEQHREGYSFSATALVHRVLLGDGRRLLLSFWLKTAGAK